MIRELMSFDDFAKEAEEKLREDLHAFPADEVEAYIVNLKNGDMQQYYNEHVEKLNKEISGIRFYPPDPDDYAYGRGIMF